jgi:hypothetical protein
MELKINQGELNRISDQIAKRAELAFNQGVEVAKGQPLDQAVRTVAQTMETNGVQPNFKGIRSKLVDLGWR